jgi:hypothetical protein
VTTPGPARWRDGLIGTITALLLVTAAGHMFLVVPNYRRLLESLGVAVSLPARLAIATSQLGLLLFALALLGIGVAYWKERHGSAGLLSTVLAVTALLAAVYLGLVGCVYWDVARVMSRIH